MTDTATPNIVVQVTVDDPVEVIDVGNLGGPKGDPGPPGPTGPQGPPGAATVDPPWITLPLNPPWTQYSQGPLQYRLVGTDLKLRGRAIGPGQQYQIFGVLPPEFRPTVQEIVPAVGYYPAVQAWTGGGVFIDTNGEVMPLEAADQWALSASVSLLPAVSAELLPTDTT